MNTRELVWLVARRELSRARERSFLLSGAAMVLLVVVVALLPRFLDGEESFDVGLAGAQRQQVAAALEDIEQAGAVRLTVTDVADEAEARAAVRAGSLDAVIVDNTAVISEGELDTELRGVLQAAHGVVLSEQRLRERGLDPAEVAAALDVTSLAETTLESDPESDGARAAIALAGVVLLFSQIILFSTWVAFGVVEEKSSRVVELLLVTLRPWQLLAGKVLGIGLLGLGQLLVVMAAGLGTVLVTGSFTIPADAYGTVVEVIGWFVLGYGFFAAAYAAAGSLVSRQEEVGGVTTPLSMLLMLGYGAAFYVTPNPEATFSKVISFVPPFSAMTMPARSADGSVAWWELALAAALMLVATVGLVRLAGRVYSGAVLRTGPRLRWSDALS